MTRELGVVLAIWLGLLLPPQARAQEAVSAPAYDAALAK